MSCHIGNGGNLLVIRAKHRFVDAGAIDKVQHPSSSSWAPLVVSQMRVVPSVLPVTIILPSALNRAKVSGALEVR
jgi:hypothetical protein